MRDAIAWGYELLTVEQQRLLQRLAVFSGGFSADLAARIVRGRIAGHGYPFADGFGIPFVLADIFDDPGPGESAALDAAYPLEPLSVDPNDGLAQLQVWSLIVPYEGPDGSSRFGMLETIREFALEQLAASGEAEACLHAHAATMLAFAEAGNEGMWVNTRKRWGLERIDAEVDNFRNAMEWLLGKGDDAADLALRLNDFLTSYWQLRGMLIEGSQYMRRALARPAGGVYRRMMVHNGLGFFYWIMGNVERPHRIFEMLTYLELATAGFESWNDWIGLGVCKLALGEAARLTDDPETAIDLFDEAFEYHSTGGYDWGVATSRYFIGEAMRDLKHDADAATYLCEGLRRYWAYGDVWGAGGCICGIACIAAARTEWATAARLFGAAYQMRERIHAVLPPTHQAAYDAISAAVLTETGEAPFAEGRRLTPPQAVEEALVHGERYARNQPVEARPNGSLKLTKRQRAVLILFAKGLDHEVIARQLDRTVQSVYAHTAAIRDAWGLNTYDELRERARELGYHLLD
jgi:DNA-binding NarL/FixJ family response regulator